MRVCMCALSVSGCSGTWEYNLAVRVYFEQAWVLSQFGYQRVSVVKALSGADLIVGLDRACRRIRPCCRA